MHETQAGTDSVTELALTPGPLVGPVLRRVVGMLAARADLPLDRLDEAVMVADVIADRAGPFAADAIQLRITPSERTLWMEVGPLAPGGAQALLAEAPNVGSVIVTLADEVHVDERAEGEHLRVCLAYAG